MGWRDVDDPLADDLAPRQRHAFLSRRIQELSEQLDRLNRLFSRESGKENQDEE
jgi:hypothetical protein